MISSSLWSIGHRGLFLFIWNRRFSSKQFCEGNFVKRDNEPCNECTFQSTLGKTNSHLQIPVTKMTALVHFFDVATKAYYRFG
ncbi:hypothetical protein CLU79DRAFT_750948 [Phycomyces nitens]|nr:hypothetical protein CLU79DRAFT_750948 [Phycomyces nitens]